jgi:hypothetical protein
MKTVNSSAARRLTSRAVSREKTKTVVVKMMDMRRGRPVRAMLVRRKPCVEG